MKYFEQMPSIDVAPLKAALDAHPELWNQIGWRNTVGDHKEVDDIWVRYNDIRKYPHPCKEFRDRHVPVWYPAWSAPECADVKAALKPILFNLMAAVQGEMLGGVLITRVPPGKQIYPHRDDGWHVEYFDKFYISIEANSNIGFYCNDEVIFPQVGDCWRFDNRRPHWVKNESDGNRVTLIVCIRTEMFQNERDRYAQFG